MRRWLRAGPRIEYLDVQRCCRKVSVVLGKISWVLGSLTDFQKVGLNAMESAETAGC